MADQPILQIEDVSKAFAGVFVLSGVSLTVFPQEIHALLGENGAGKSTLLKILCGIIKGDGGGVRLDGAEVAFHGPRDALAHGIVMVQQEVSLVPQMNAIQNIVLGREPSQLGLINWRAARKKALECLAQFEFSADPTIAVRRLSVAQQQVVELARALAINARLIILDEPTSSLSIAEARRLFDILRALKARGHSIVYVSHRLQEATELADRVTVLRDGQVVAALSRGEIQGEEHLVRLMVGRTLGALLRGRGEPGAELLRVSHLSRKRVLHDISFVIRAGEIVGLAGMVGSGRTEVARAIIGADRRDRGHISLGGRDVDVRTPAQALRAGIAYLPEDRKTQGLCLQMTLASNTTLGNVPARFGLLQLREQRLSAAHFLEEVDLRVPVMRLARQLSGGQQQKVVFARWVRNNSAVFIFDEPTRGIDVGTKREIYRLIQGFAEEGKAILLISSELPEVLLMSDRVLVMRDGRVVGELSRADASEEAILRMAATRQSVEMIA